MVKFNELSITPDGSNMIIDIEIMSQEYYSELGIEGVYINTDEGYLDSGFNSDASIYTETFGTPKEATLTFYKDQHTKFKTNIVNAFLFKNPSLSIGSDILIEDLPNQKIYIDSITNSYIQIHHPKYPNNPIYISTNDDLWIDSIPSIENAFVVPHQGTTSYPRKLRLQINCKDPNLNVASFNNNLFFVYVKTHGTIGPCAPCGADNQTTLGVTFNSALLYNKGLSYIKELSSNCKISKDFIDFILQVEALKISINTGHNIEAIKFYKKLFKTLSRSSFNCSCYG